MTAPRNARSEKQIMALKRTNVCVGDFSIQFDELRISISEQPWGAGRVQHIDVPRGVFDTFVDWYMLGVVPKEDARSRRPPSEGKKRAQRKATVGGLSLHSQRKKPNLRTKS